MKQKILGTGLSGLVGSRVVELLSNDFSFADASYDTGVDITNAKSVDTFIGVSDASWIIHFAAKTDVDGCEKDKKNAWTINVDGTKHIVAAAQKYGKKVLFISTDFVFDGTRDFYNEESTPHPINYYAVTKYEGERIVAVLPHILIVRIAYPYRAQFTPKKDFVRAIIEKLQKNETVFAPNDNICTPTFIDDIADGIKVLISNNHRGIYHVVGSSNISSYDAAVEIAHVFSLDASHIQPTTASAYYQNKAPRPLRLGLKNDKIRALGVQMRTFKEGLHEVKKQMQHNG